VLILRAVFAVLLSAVLATSALSSARQNDDLGVKVKETTAFLLKQRQTPAYRESLRKSVIAYESSLTSRCMDVTLDFDSAAVKDRLLGLLELNKSGEAVAGSWRESVPGSACDRKRLYNVQVDYTEHGPRFTATFPGEAAGDPELQRDTLRNIERNFAILHLSPKKSCHLEVIDTHAVGAASTIQDNGIMTPWKESWDIQSCDKVYSAPVTYTPDAKGTAISVETSGIQPR